MRWEEQAALPAALVAPSKRTIWVRDTATESGGRRNHRHSEGKTLAALRHLILVDQALPVVRRMNAIRKRGAELEPEREARRQARAARTGRPPKRVPAVQRWTLLMCGEGGGFQSYGHWRKHLYVAQAKCGVEYDAHDLRHVCASVLYAAGEGPSVITSQMGHEDERTTRRIYRHLFAVDHTEVARRVSAKIAAITEAERAAAEDAAAAEDGGAGGTVAVEPDDDWL
ncbi:hypothetical protein HIDPHFAB_04843 [Nocardioides sp. T2.26MG-1]|nr:hypothetical protein HIDPHFAB_04843 [Nocardioides sp. T2.26MG-1]